MGAFKNQSLLFCISTLIIISSCSTEDAIDTSGSGVFQRLLNIEYSHTSEAFVLEDIKNSGIKMDFELFGEQGGNNVEKIEWHVRYRSNDSISEPILYQTFLSKDFNRNENDLLVYSCELKASVILEKLNLEIFELEEESEFIIDARIILNDGRVFNAINSDNDLQGQNGFDGFFRLIVPLEYNFSLVGEYSAYTQSINYSSEPVCLNSIWEGKLIIEEDGNGAYIIKTQNQNGDLLIDLSCGLYYVCYGHENQDQMPNGNLRLEDDLGRLYFSGASQWAETYSFLKVEPDGKMLTLEFTNTYDEKRRTIITRTEGNWFEGLRK